MRLSRIALVLVLVPTPALISCAQQEEGGEAESIEMGMVGDLEAVGNAIAAANDAFTQAFVDGDAAALAAMYAEDGMWMAPNEETVRGREGIEARFAEQFGATTARNLTLETFDYGASGDLAYAAGNYTLALETEGEPVTDQGKYLVLMKLTADGDWEIVAHIWNSDLPEE